MRINLIKGQLVITESWYEDVVSLCIIGQVALITYGLWVYNTFFVG